MTKQKSDKPARFVLSTPLLLALPLTGCSQEPRSIGAPEMLARVMDAETGEPVVGAAVEVTVHVEKPTSSIEHTDSKVIHSHKTTVGADGRFMVPAWGPVDIPSGWHLVQDDPGIKITKEGYEFTIFSNAEWNHLPKKDASGPTILGAAWDHQTLLSEKEGFFDAKKFGRVMYPLDDLLAHLPGRSKTH